VNKHLKRVALIALGATLGACSHHPSETQGLRVRVQTSKATIRSVPEVESAIGNVGQGFAPVIGTRRGGLVTQILVAPGQLVQSQQRLARLRPMARAGKTGRLVDIRAPSAGIITRILVQTGAKVRAGARLFGFAGPSVRKARLPFPLSLAPHLHIGQSILLHSPLAPRAPVLGVIAHLDSHPKDNVIYALIDLPPRRGWAPGSPVRADVVVARRPALLVPQTSIALRVAGTVVFVLHHSRVEMRRVKIGARFSQDVIITQGLTPGTIVVTDANQLLTNGMRVTVASAEKP